MSIPHSGSMLALLGLALFGTALTAAGLRAEHPAAPVSPQQVRAAIDKSLTFLRNDAAQWRKRSSCATCHHGAITAWAIGEAKARGFTDAGDSLKDMLEWSKARFVPPYEEKPNLSNGFDIPSLAMPILVATQWSQPEALSTDDQEKMAKYILDRQQADGGWILQPKSAHPVFESREVLSTWFYLALEPVAAGNGRFAAAARTGREKALAYIARSSV
jgi:hypothetical protein